MIRQLSLAALGAALLWSTPARAQLPHLLPAGSPWLDINYPKLFWTPAEGLTGGGYLAIVRQLSADDADAASPYAGAIALNGQASTSGSRELTLEGRFPALVNGWRFVATLAASRHARANYFGIGNATTFDEANVTSTQKHYYQAIESSTLARGEIQRRVIGGLRALVGIHAENRQSAPLPGPSLLALDLASSTYPAGSAAHVMVRGGLVFDTRDDEPSPNRGVMLEAIHAVSTGSTPSYSRTTVSGAGYVRAGENIVFSARAMAQSMGGTPRIDAYQLIEASDRPYNGLGGAVSHRALDENRFLGRHKILLNLDARYHLGIPRAARGSVVLFLDAGRVFEGESLRLTTDDLKVGGGIGLFAQIGRAGIIGTTLGAGPDGPVVNVATRWAY